MNIFVANLNYATTEEELESFFSSQGEVDSVKIVIDRETNKSKGFGFVTMPNSSEAKNAITNLNDAVLRGRNIAVKEAQPKKAGAR